MREIGALHGGIWVYKLRSVCGVLPSTLSTAPTRDRKNGIVERLNEHRHQLAPRAGEPVHRAARRLAERERTAPHAKLLSRRGFMGHRPQLRAHTSKLYGKMMRRLIDTECRQVYELQHTQTVHRDETYKAHRRFRVRKRGGAPPPG